jgi:hypothetical protein
MWPEISQSLGSVGPARSAATSTATAVRGSETNLALSSGKIARQQCRVAREARDATVGMLKHDKVKLPAASRNLSGNLTRFVRVDPLFQQP